MLFIGNVLSNRYLLFTMETATLFAFLIFWCCFEYVVVAGGLWMMACEEVEFEEDSTSNKESDATTRSPTVVDERLSASGGLTGTCLVDPASMPLPADRGIATQCLCFLIYLWIICCSLLAYDVE